MLKIIDISRWILTLFLIVLIGKETGIFTGLGFALIALRLEMDK